MTPETAKSISHSFLLKHGIPINEHLPFIESKDELKPQDAQAIARRCVILSYVIGIAYGADTAKLNKYLSDVGLIKYASAKERDLLGRATHTKQEVNNARWLAESVQGLAWCIGLIEMSPFKQCDNTLASNFPKPYFDPSQFIERSQLRPFNEIYQQADLHYRLHWAARNFRISGVQCIVNEELIMERRKSLDWVIGVEEDWDEITLDT